MNCIALRVAYTLRNRSVARQPPGPSTAGKEPPPEAMITGSGIRHLLDQYEHSISDLRFDKTGSVRLGAPSDHFSHEQVFTFNAKHKGIGLFYDCLETQAGGYITSRFGIGESSSRRPSRKISSSVRFI
ncbi:MAG: hypothetical protein JRH18_06260 [Deltaproteobacteria bacterium]|nr:hypothetical protein [Deltaproteobacteria bacterium]